MHQTDVVAWHLYQRPAGGVQRQRQMVRVAFSVDGDTLSQKKNYTRARTYYGAERTFLASQLWTFGNQKPRAAKSFHLAHIVPEAFVNVTQ